MTTLTLTEEQQTLLEAWGTGRSGMATARAGSGKSFMCCESAKTGHLRGMYLAFNKANATEVQPKMPAGIKCKTLHSVGYSALRDLVNMAGRTLRKATSCWKRANGAPKARRTSMARNRTTLTACMLRRWKKSDAGKRNRNTAAGCSPSRR